MMPAIYFNLKMSAKKQEKKCNKLWIQSSFEKNNDISLFVQMSKFIINSNIDVLCVVRNTK